MRRFLYAFFALAVFTTASSGLCTLPADSPRPCAMASSDLGLNAAPQDSAMPSCCCGLPDAQTKGEGSCPSNAPKCSTTSSASLQLGLTQEREEFRSASASTGTNPSEPKPWPPSFSSDWLRNADSPGVLPIAFFGARPGLLAEACEQGRSAIENLARLGVFRI